MEGTCDEKNCKFHDLIGGTLEQCPNFVETWWSPKEGNPKLVRDCAPRRSLLMTQDLYNRFIGLQQAQEEQRNESGKVLKVFARLLKQAAANNGIDDGGEKWRLPIT